MNIKLALKYFFLAYLIGTILGFVTFYIHITVMWISLFTIMPIVFGYFFYLYLKNSNCSLEDSFRASSMLILFWIISSFVLDGFVYVVVIPFVLGVPSNWMFFVDQSPWIWLNYATIVVLGYISKWVYLKGIKEPGF